MLIKTLKFLILADKNAINKLVFIQSVGWTVILELVPHHLVQLILKLNAFVAKKRGLSAVNMLSNTNFRAKNSV